MGSSQLSRRGAFLMGLTFIAFGVSTILLGLGIITPDNPEPGTPTWVPVCAGVMFVVAGLVVILDFAIAGGTGPDGDFLPGTPFAIRLGNLVLGIMMLGSMIAIFGWVAFGSGPRRFSSSISLPFVSQRWSSGEISGRTLFGAWTVFMIVFLVGCTVAGVRRLWRARNG